MTRLFLPPPRKTVVKSASRELPV